MFTQTMISKSLLCLQTPHGLTPQCFTKSFPIGLRMVIHPITCGMENMNMQASLPVPAVGVSRPPVAAGPRWSSRGCRQIAGPRHSGASARSRCGRQALGRGRARPSALRAGSGSGRVRPRRRCATARLRATGSRKVPCTTGPTRRARHCRRPWRRGGTG